MLNMENNRVQIIVIIAIIAFIAILVLSYAFGNGWSGVLNTIKTFGIILVFLSVIGVVIAIIYFLFIYVKKINAVEEVYKNIESETIINQPENLGFLWTTGDSEHIPVRLGQIIGYAKRMNYDITKDPKNQEVYCPESLFRVTRYMDNPFMNMITRLFSKKFIVRCPMSLHDRLQGDVHIQCVGLVKHGYFYFPDCQHLNMKAIDLTLFNEAMRYNNLKIPEYSNPLIMKALGITRFDKKELEGLTGLQTIQESVPNKGGNQK